MDYFNLTAWEAPIMKIEFKFQEAKNYGVAINILERNKALRRRILKSNYLSY